MPQPNEAQATAALVTIPNACRNLTVNPSAALDLGAVAADEGVAGTYDLRGRWVWIEAVGVDVRILRDANTIVWPNGLLLVAGAAPREFFVDRESAKTLQAVTGGGAGNLLVHFDGEVR